MSFTVLKEEYLPFIHKEYITFGYEEEFIKIAQKYIQIVTVTKECKSNKFESITYSELNGDTLRFRENVELLPSEIINSLSIWPDYKLII